MDTEWLNFARSKSVQSPIFRLGCVFFSHRRNYDCHLRIQPNHGPGYFVAGLRLDAERRLAPMRKCRSRGNPVALTVPACRCVSPSVAALLSEWTNSYSDERGEGNVQQCSDE